MLNLEYHIDIEKLRQENEMLKEKYQYIVAKNDEIQNDRHQLAHSAMVNNEYIASLLNAEDSKRIINEDLSAEVKRLTDKHKRLKRVILDKCAEIKAQDEQNLKLMTDLATCKEILNQKELELCEANHSNSMLNDMYKRCSQEKKSLEEVNKLLSEKEKYHRNEYSELNSKAAGLEMELQDLEDKLKQKEVSSSAIYLEKENICKELSKSKAIEEVLIKNIEKMQEIAKRKDENIKIRLEQSDVKIKRLEETNSKSQKEILILKDSLEKEQRALLNACEKLKIFHHKDESENLIVEEFRKTNDELKNQLAAMEKLHLNDKMEYKNLLIKIQDLQDIIRNQSLEIAEFQSKLMNEQRERETLKGNNQDLLQYVEKIKQVHESKRERNNQHLIQNIANCKQFMTDYFEKILLTQANLVKKENTISGSTNDIKMKMKVLKEVANENQRIALARKEEIEAKTNEIQSLKDRLKEIDLKLTKVTIFAEEFRNLQMCFDVIRVKVVLKEGKCPKFT
jgi:Cu/Ag efflux protein CusF